METREDPNHGPDGKFASSDSSGQKETATSKLAKFAKALKALPGNVATAVKNKATTFYGKMVDKYGPIHAKAILGVAIVTLPTPFTTPSVLLACGLASLSNRLIGKRDMDTRANAKHKDDGTFDQTDGNKAHSTNLAKCAAVLGTMKPKTKQQVTSLADAFYGKIQQPFDAQTVLGVAIASMPPPVATHQVLAAGALGYLAQSKMVP